MFPTVEYAERVSHFDPKSTYTDFKGFYVLFWVGLAIMVITTALRNIKETGLPLRLRPWHMFTVNLLPLWISELLMVCSTAAVLPLQRTFRASRGALRWRQLGMPLHVTFQTAWAVLWVNWPFLLQWTWTAQVFFTLHMLVILMKMHSYAFYNGHLGTTEDRLEALDEPKAGTSLAAAVHYPSSSDPDASSPSSPNRALRSPTTRQEEKEAATAKLEYLREDLARELTSPLGNVTFPQNLTLGNYVDYLFCPTLCYELEYPRVPHMQKSELFFKTLAVFGCVFLLTITSEEFIVPVLADSAKRLEAASSVSDGVLVMAETISNLLWPFTVTFLLVFLVIFEYICGAFAELTCFADRAFYSDWWNSCDWLEFSREWNIPVHNFLRRHVYGASLPYMGKGMATTLTFFVSAVLHELVMGCITKKLRGYGFVAMMLQIPLVAIQRSKWLRGKKLFNVGLHWRVTQGKC